jgi:hypothetical protein
MQRVAVGCHRPARGPGVAVGVCAGLSLVLFLKDVCGSNTPGGDASATPKLEGHSRGRRQFKEVSMTRSVDICIARRRRKIEIDPHRPRFIRTAHGDAYVLTTSTETN